MFSARLLRYDLIGDRIEPCYIDDRYAELVRTLKARYEAAAGKPYREIEADLASSPEVLSHDPRVVRGLRETIEEHIALETPSGVSAEEVRRVAFALAAQADPFDRRAVLQEAAKALSVPAEKIPDLLYSDLRSERRLALRSEIPGPAEITRRYNLRLLQTFFRNAQSARIEADSKFCEVYRAAKAHGLLLELKAAGRPGGKPCLEIIGPLGLEGRARKYALAVARFVPCLLALTPVKVGASVIVGGRKARLELGPGDLHRFPLDKPALEESPVGLRFRKDFASLDSKWEIAPATEPLTSAGSGFLPDFAFRLRSDPNVRAYLEILGFWTGRWAARRRALAERMQGCRVIFCADERLSADTEPEEFPGISFRNRLPAEEVLRALESIAGR